MKYDSKATLWAAVTALMDSRYGGENLNRLSREAKMSPASASRLKAQETSVGLEILDKLSEAFGVPQWQLLVPNYSPNQPPILTGNSPMAKDIADLFDKLEEDKRAQAYALVVQLLTFGLPPTPPVEPTTSEPQPSPEPTTAPARRR